MSDAPFDQTNIGLRERPVSSDWNRNASQSARTLREVLQRALEAATIVRDVSGFVVSPSPPVGAPVTGFVGSGLYVTPANPVAMSVVVNPGVGFIYDAVDIPTNIGATDLEQVNDLGAYKPVPLLAPVTFAVPVAPGAPNSRIDIIEVRTNRHLTDSTTRRQLDPGTESYFDHVFSKTLSYLIDGNTGTVTSPAASTAALSYKVGVAANPGLMPATTAGYTKIAEIYVPNGTTSIAVTKIADQRVIAAPGGVIEVSVQFHLSWNTGSPTVKIESVIAPPSVEVLVKPEATIGVATICVIAGSRIVDSTVAFASVCTNGGTPPLLTFPDPSATAQVVASAPNGGSTFGFGRPVTQYGTIARVKHAVLTPGSPAAVDFTGGTAGLTEIDCCARFSLRAE